MKLCNDANCNLPKDHKGKHEFCCKGAWTKKFLKKDIDKINKAGYCTPRGGDKGGYQNHVDRDNRVIIPFEKLKDVNLNNYQDGWIIRLFPSQYFESKGKIKDCFNHKIGVKDKEKNSEYIKIKVGKNAFVLYRTFEDLENFPPLKNWKVRYLVKKDKKTKKLCETKRRGKNVHDKGQYILRISAKGKNHARKEGPPQGIFAPEYANKRENYLCQAVLAWLTINTLNSPYDPKDFLYLQAILNKHNLLKSNHYENQYIMHNGITTCPLCQQPINYKELNENISLENEEGLENSQMQVKGSTRSTEVNLFHMVPLCYEELEDIPTQVAWGHAVCNTRLGQHRCYSYQELLKQKEKIFIYKGGKKTFLGYINQSKKFIRSQKGDVWIRISKRKE